MPINATSLADHINQHMRRNALDVLTMRWPAFYKFCGRERLKSGFIVALTNQLGKENILFVDGESVVAFVKDHDFSPMR
jgi:uncharacterized protein YneR